jgi:tetratricopeptide (TPR) repeat protein
MKTKEMTITLPLVIGLYEFLFFGGRRLKRLLFLLPLLLTMLIIPLSLIGVQKPVGQIIGDVSEVTKLQTDISRWDYLLTQFTVIARYLRLIFLPTGQNLDYDYPLYRSFLEPKVFLSFFLLFGIFCFGICALVRSRHKEEQNVTSGPSAPCLSPFAVSSFRLVAFGIFWFFITLSVESGLIPIQDLIFEHRMYLPSVGVFLAITTGLFIVGQRFRAGRKTIVAALCLAVVLLAGATYSRNMVWKDDVTLWSDVVAKSPNKARGYNNLGIGYQKRKEMDRAMEMYRKATTLTPVFIDAYYNLGFTYLFQNQPDQGYYNIGIFYALKGRYEDALSNYTKALAANPGFAKAYNSRGLLYASAGRYDEALSDYNKAISADPSSAPARNNRGVLYAANGRPAEALEDLDRAIALDPGYADAYYNRGVVLARSARNDRAASDFREACRLGNKEACSALKGGTPAR